MNKTKKLVSEMAILFAKVHNKLNKLEKRAVDFGGGEKLHASELHAIDAIGNKSANTVTGLCNLFGITKGAVSQIIKKLEGKNYISRERNMVYGKEIDITLTDKGRIVFEAHLALHEEMDRELLGFMKTIPESQLAGFIEMLSKMEKYVDKFLAK